MEGVKKCLDSSAIQCKGLCDNNSTQGNCIPFLQAACDLVGMHPLNRRLSAGPEEGEGQRGLVAPRPERRDLTADYFRCSCRPLA